MRRLCLFALFVAGAARADELHFDIIRQSLTGTHVRYQQFIDGIPVIGGERIERIDHAGIRTTRDSLARRGFSHAAAAIVGEHGGDLVYLNVSGVARRALRRVVADSLHERYARYYDAATGELLRSDPLFFHSAARVFDPNPVARLNEPALQDRNDAAAAVPDAAYSFADLPGLPSAGPLRGPNVQIVDAQAPFTTRPDASQPLLFDRSQPQFEEVNAYFHIDRSQRYMQSLGYSGARRIAGYAIPVDPHAVNGTDTSIFAVGDVRGEGALYFGDGGTDDAEDSDIMLHEFAHAIHESIAPEAFGGASSSESRALAEGFGDYWAFSSSYAGTVASGRDPFCIGDWDARCWTGDSDQKCGYPAGSDCLRRVDGTKTMADFLPVGESGSEHRNGEIWSSALREIFLALTARHGVEQGRRVADSIVLEGLFGTPSNPTYAGQAQKLLEADLALNGGGNRNAICRAMTARAILAIGDCGTSPRGELTLFQSTSSILHVADSRSIEQLFVRVQTDGAAGRVTLIAPDGTSILLATAPRADATYGVDALPQQSLAVLHNRVAAGDWQLVVEGGQLRSWSLLIQFAGDAPLASRPTTSDLRKHVFAVAHVLGAANTMFLSDVRIYNRSEFTASPIVIFTPSGADGHSQFAAVRLSIEPHRVLVLNDVVRATLQTSGIGQLELLGDPDRILVNSRTYSPTGEGTYGETIPAFDTVDAGGDEIAPLQNSSDYRSNVGVAEVFGISGIARFTFFSSTGAHLGSTDMPIEAFGHAQVRVPVFGTNLRAVVSIASGNPRLFAYGSVVDNRSGDAITIPASRLPRPAETVAIPAIRASGAGGTEWRTDLWRLTRGGRVEVAANVGTALEALFIESDGAVVASRTYTSSDCGSFGQFIPALRAPESTAPQQLIGIEESSRFRTNVGLINFAFAPVTVTVLVYDAAGREAGRATTVVPPRSLRQLPVATIVAGALTDGRIEVRGVAAYASVIDNSTQDPSFITGQY